MRKIDGDALKAIITSWIARTTHGEQTILSESIRETLRGVIEYINTLPTQKDMPLPHAEWIDAFGDAQYAKCSRCGELYEVLDCATTHKSNMWHDGTAQYWFPLPKPPKEEKA